MRHPRTSLLLLGCLFTLLNAAKPLHIDDAAYSFYAGQIARRPLDPYGFAVFWYQHPQPANEVLAPPLLPYGWALAERLGADRPWQWKLGLLPFVLLFVAALYALARRVARGAELPLVWLTVLSPTFLPSLNLMLDVPALALSLAAVAAFWDACDRDARGDGKGYLVAALAGLVAGLAAQTKYTGLLAVPLMFLQAALFGRLRLALVAALVAAHVFAGWELLTALLYGESHFGVALRDGAGSLWDKGYLGWPLLTNLGGVAPALVLLGLAALGARRGVLVVAGLAGLAGYALVALVDDETAARLSVEAPPGAVWPGVALEARFPELVYAVAGLALGWLAGFVVARRCLWPLVRGERVLRPHAGWPGVIRPKHRLAWFLALWLALEVVGYFVLTPFEAVRRLMGVVVVLTLLFGSVASRTCRGRAGLLWGVTAYGAALGLGFFAVDLIDARAQQSAAEAAASWARQQGGRGTVWFVGHWGFQFYAGRAGMVPVVPDYPRREGSIPLPPPSVLRRGDWLVVPDARQNQQQLHIPEDRTEAAQEIPVEDALPLRTVMGYYGGSVPLDHHQGPRRAVTIYRVTADFPARAP